MAVNTYSAQCAIMIEGFPWQWLEIPLDPIVSDRFVRTQLIINHNVYPYHTTFVTFVAWAVILWPTLPKQHRILGMKNSQACYTGGWEEQS